MSELDKKCAELRKLVMNPYAVARYVDRKKEAERQWKLLASKSKVRYKNGLR